jgi:hypothetical protein
MPRFQKPTLIEGFVIVCIIVVLALLLLSPDTQSVTRRQLELRVRDWKPAPLDLLSDSELLAGDIDLSGDWSTRLAHSGSSITFERRSDEDFNVHFSTGGCQGGCEWSRTAAFVEGVITMDRAVAPYDRRAFNTLYAIRIDGTDYLLAEPDVLRFEEERRRAVGNWGWYVFKRGSNRIPQEAPAEPVR